MSEEEKAVPEEDVALEEEQTPTKGVFVVVIEGEHGEESFDTVPQGVKATEVETILGLGLKAWRRKIGLAE